MKKILIVDDQEEIRELLQLTLQWGGFKELLTASGGQEAVDIALREKPDLILMDVMMPGEINGIQATSILKRHPEWQDRVIVMLSARVQEADIERGIQAGTDYYWEKPFSPLELLGKVERILQTAAV